MAPSRQTRKSRRLSCMSPMDAADYDWQSLALLHSGPDVEIAPSAVHLGRSSPSACTTASSNSPASVVTHLPFTPGSSHTRNRKEGHIPRPPNAFMVFRSWLWNNDNLKSVERDNRNVSRIAGRYWNELSETERAPFRCMAEEAKARHAQLYPEYKYSPGSQKKPKVSQRRSQRTNNVENENCKKVADLLLGGVASRDLTKYLGEGNKKSEHKEEAAPVLAAQEMFSSVPSLKRSAPPRGESPPPQSRSKKLKAFPVPLISAPSSQYAAPAAILPAIEERSETTHTPGLLRTPELPDALEEFVATGDIPHLSLDGRDDTTIKKHRDNGVSILVPSHLEPAVYSVLSGVKPEATSFVESCVLGAYTTLLPSTVPFSDFDVEPYPSLLPLGSPVFTNPFETSTPTASHEAMLGTLDQLFGQPISPLSASFFSDFDI